MATPRERQFNFRLSAQGFAEFARELQATGAAGQAALTRLVQASPELASSLGKAAEAMQRQVEATQRVGEAAENTARRVQAAGAAIGSTGGFNRIGQGADQLEGRLKGLNRTLNDVSGAMGFLGVAGGSVASQIDPARRAIGGLADVAGTAAAAFGAGSGAGLFGALTRFIPIVGAAVGAYQIFSALLNTSSGESDRAASGNDQHGAAMRRLVEATETATERLARLNEEKRRGLELDLQNIRGSNESRLEQLQARQLDAARRVTQRGAELAEIEGQAALVTGVGGELSSGAQRRIAGRRSQFEEAKRDLDAATAAVRALEAEMINVEVRAGQAATAIGQTAPAAERAQRGVGGLSQTMERLNEQADRAARTIVDRLLRESETDWQRYEREVNEAQAAMARLARNGQLTADEMARINASLEAASPAAQEARRAADAARREQEKAAEEFNRVWQRATDTAVKASGDLFFDLFTGRATSIGDTLRQALLRAVADAAANFVLRPLIAPIIGAVGSGVGQILGAGVSAVGGAAGGLGGLFGGGGGIGNLGSLLNLGSTATQLTTGKSLLGSLGGLGAGIDAFGASIGFANVSPSFVGPLLPTQSAGLTLSGALGAAGIGFGAGTLLGAFGANRTTSSIGGAGIGALGGFLVGGPIGAVVGGLGGVAGGLFGGARRPGFTGGEAQIGFDPETSELRVISTSGKRYDPGAVIAAAQPVLDQTNALFQQLGLRIDPTTPQWLGNAFGVGSSATPNSLDHIIRWLATNGRLSAPGNPTFDRIVTGGFATTTDDLAEAGQFAALFDQLREGEDTASQLERTMKTLREQLGAARDEAVRFGFSIQEIDTAARGAFERDITRALRGYTDPVGLALEEFDRAAQLRLEVARELGANLVDVERLNALEREQVLQAASGQITQGLRRLVDDVAFGGLSSASPEQRYFQAITRLNQAERDALASPTNAAKVGEFEAAARAALPIARDFLGTSQRYGELESRVLGSAIRLDPASDPAGLAANRIVEAQAIGASAIVESQGRMLAELIQLRAEVSRQNATIEALLRKVA